MAIFDRKRSNLTPQNKPLKEEKNFIKFYVHYYCNLILQPKIAKIRGKKPFYGFKNGHF